MYKQIIKPTLVLIIIVAVMSGLLAFTYHIAGIKDLGRGISPEELDAVKSQVLPEATRLVFTDVEYENPDFFGVYKDETNKGYAIHLQTKGYGKEPIKLLVGINPNGEVAGIKILSSTETPNIGTKIEDPAYLENYNGKSGKLTIKKDGGEIDEITNATISSRALASGVTTALEIYHEIKGGL